MKFDMIVDGKQIGTDDTELEQTVAAAESAKTEATATAEKKLKDRFNMIWDNPDIPEIQYNHAKWSNGTGYFAAVTKAGVCALNKCVGKFTDVFGRRCLIGSITEDGSSEKIIIFERFAPQGESRSPMIFFNAAPVFETLFLIGEFDEVSPHVMDFFELLMSRKHLS